MQLPFRREIKCTLGRRELRQEINQDDFRIGLCQSIRCTGREYWMETVFISWCHHLRFQRTMDLITIFCNRSCERCDCWSIVNVVFLLRPNCNCNDGQRFAFHSYLCGFCSGCGHIVIVSTPHASRSYKQNEITVVLLPHHYICLLLFQQVFLFESKFAN